MFGTTAANRLTWFEKGSGTQSADDLSDWSREITRPM